MGMHYAGGSGAGHAPGSFSSPGDRSQTTPRAKGTVRRVVKLFRPYRLKVLGILGILMVVAALGIVNPYMLKL
ncbi:MAG: hypothetical protein WA809_04415, partial [Candidatus Dormiibacterota bacterium]